MCAFLAHRYPEAFIIKRGRYDSKNSATHGESIGGEAAGAIVQIENRLTGDVFDFEKLRESEGAAWSPMKYAGCTRVRLPGSCVLHVADDPCRLPQCCSKMI